MSASPPGRRTVLLACRSAIVAALLVLIAAPSCAWAHAQLQQTSPQRDAVAPRAPKVVSFTFDEAVGGAPGAVRVFDGQGRRVDTGEAFHPGGRGPTIGVGLKPGIPAGTYTATYRVVSADTHIVTGGVVFSVGHRDAGRGATVGQLLAGQETGPVTSWAFVVTKAVQYAAIGVAGGLVAFLLLVWLPVLRALAGGTQEWERASERLLARTRAGLLALAAAGVLSAAIGVVLQGAQGSGVSFWGAVNQDVLRAVLHSRFGTVWALGLAAWVVVGLAAAVLLRRSDARGISLARVSLGADGAVLGAASRRRTIGLAAPLAALLLLPGLAGHASVQHPVWLFLPANVAHVCAMSVWLGGLAALLLAVPVATRELGAASRTTLLFGVLERFSPLALASVIVLVGTGTIQALLQISAFSQLLHTAYGRAVLVKVGLILGLIALGAVNRRRTLPALQANARAGTTPGAAGITLRRTLRLEVAVIAAVLVVSGALSGYAPAKDAATGPVEITSRLGPAQLSMDVEPALVGPNELHIYLFDAKSGAQYDKTKQLTVTAELPSKGIGPLTLEPQVSGPGHYTIANAVLGAPGTWRIHLTARVSDFDQYERTVTVPIR